MGKYILILNSITYAYTARDILYSNSITCYIERIPENMRKTGCGYGVSIRSNPDIAVKLLEAKGIRVRDIIKL